MPILLALLLTGCDVMAKNDMDATERGLSYVASAIVLSAIFRAFFNE